MENGQLSSQQNGAPPDTTHDLLRNINGSIVANSTEENGFVDENSIRRLSDDSTMDMANDVSPKKTKGNCLD